MIRMAALLALLVSTPVSADDVLIDHILWGTPNLVAGAEHIANITGIAPVFGGVHPGVGTANNLISLGPRTYLEIIGPNPDTPDISAPRVDAIRALTAPAMLTFAISTTDIDAMAAAAKEIGLVTYGPEAGSRAKPDGDILRWRALGFGGHDFGQAIPFAIDWGTSAHPATTSPDGAKLVSLTVIHPRAEALQAVYEALGIPAEVIQADPGEGGEGGEGGEFIARISTPKGEIELRGPIARNSS